MTTLVFSSATMLMVFLASFDSCSILPLLSLQGIIHNFCHRSIPVIHMDLNPLLFQRPHRLKPLFLIGTAAPHPNMDILELPLCPYIPEAGNNPGKGLLDIGKVRYRPPDDDMLDVRKRADPLSEGLYCPVGRASGELRIIGDLPALAYNGIRIRNTCPAAGRKKR